jgi:hypothetical protein
MDFELTPRKIFQILLLIIIVLLMMNIVFIVYQMNFNNGVIYRILRLFDFDTEANIPTFYSAINLAISSLLLFLIAVKHRIDGSSYLYWAGLGLVFLFLAVDETASLHEILTIPFRRLLNTSGCFYYAWVIPYSLFFALFSIAYLKFLVELPRRTMWLFIASGLVFVAGAIGFELLGGAQDYRYGDDNVMYYFLYSCEELFEMAGVALFIYTLLSYITHEFRFVSIRIDENP